MPTELLTAPGGGDRNAASTRIDRSATGAAVRPPRPRLLPLAVAIGCFLLMATVVLRQPERMIEPDPYAYRASIAALEDGNVTLTQDEYEALATELQSSPLGGGILQWHQTDDGRWISEKNPGYPFLAVAFDEVGALRLAPLFSGALACVGLWLGGRRWLGRWGGALAVAGWCSATVGMVMAWRSTMPTYTDASLVALGVGLLVWLALAVERPRRHRVLVGAAAFLALGLAVFVRYTNVTVLAVGAAFAVALCLRARWRLGPRTLVWWALAAVPPLVATLAYNAAVFEGPFSTGYASSSVQFTLSAIPDNLRLMPSHLVQSMPVVLLALAAVVGIVVGQVRHRFRRRGRAAAVDGAVDVRPSDAGAIVGVATDDQRIDRASRDRWIGLFLVGAWAATWGVYAAYQWTAQMAGMGGRGPGGDVTYHIVRFYVPALGSIALLAAWLLVRLPKQLALVVVTGLLVLGTVGFIGYATTADAGVPGGMGGPGGGAGLGPFPGGFAPTGRLGDAGAATIDLSSCAAPPAGALPTGAGQLPPVLGGGDQGEPPVGITLDDDGCPVFPTTTTTPDASGS